MKREKKEGFFQDKEFIILAIILIITEKCFYLSFIVDNVRPLLLQDIVVILYIIFGLYVFIKYKNIDTPKCNFTLIFLFNIVLAIFSAGRAFQLFGQSFFLGFRQQRYFIVYYLMYIPFNKFLYAKEDNIEKVKTLLANIGAAEVIFYNIQYVLRGTVMLISVSTSIRYGGLRLHIESVLMTIFYFVCLSDLLKGKKVKKNIFLLVMILYYNFFVIRGRLAIVGLLLVTVGLILLWRRNLFIKISSILFGVIILIVMSNIPMFNNYLSVLNSNTRNKDATALIREEAKNFYKKEISKSPILGRGVANELNAKARIAAGIDKGYFFNDNGLVAFIYMYGYLGLGWLIAFWGLYYFYALKVYFKKKEYLFLGHIVYLTIIVSNIMECYWPYGAFYMGISVSMLEITFQGTLSEKMKKIESKSNVEVK